MSPRWPGFALSLVLLAAGTHARAADGNVSVTGTTETGSSAAKPTATADDPVRAKILFDQAVELASAGNFPEACKKLEESKQVHDGIGTSFHLAGCWQKVGRTASAYALFEDVVKRSTELGQTERADLARTRMAALAPKLSRLRIELAERAPKTEVYRNDVAVPESDWGKAVAVDRGAYTLRVTAEGKKEWTQKVDVSEPSIVMAITVPALAPVAPPAPPVAVVAKKAPPKEEPKPEPKPEPSGSGARTRAVIIGGVGVAALAFGAFETAKYFESNQDAKGICPSSVNCTEQEIAAHEQAVTDAKTARTWAIVGLGVGGATVGLATYLFFSAPQGATPPDEKRSAKVAVEPILDPRGNWGAVLSGRF